MNNIKEILVLGEKNIFLELLQIIELAMQANAILNLMFKDTSDSDFLKKKMFEIRLLEKKSDEIAFNLSEEITAGAVSPNIIDDLLQSTHLADDILDLHFYLGRELARMAKADVSKSQISEEVEWTGIYQQLLLLTERPLEKLHQILSSDSVPEILQKRKEIQGIEEEGDDIKDEGFDKLYSLASKLHFLQFYHYTEILHKIDDILDTCEDLSDVIVSVVTSILK